MKAWMSGNVAGTGTFRCTECDYPVSLDAVDELPTCPNCGGTEFVRASLFTTTQSTVIDMPSEVEDHGWLEEDWFELSPHVQAVAWGYNGYDIDVLREGATIFAALLRDHVALEESFIYPQAREAMPPAQRREMGREMAERHRAERTSRRPR